jgi:hypothetical protein
MGASSIDDLSVSYMRKMANNTQFCGVEYPMKKWSSSDYD